ncbi:MAG: two component regulator propeller domain protein [Fibrobacteres bacterium]|nr:two component regulator propeller domain protein [Fibrobacterota bacterium]
MSIRKICATIVLAWAISPAANLQTQDILFFSTHKFPTQVVGDSKNAFILTEGGVLMYDYRRSSWMDNLFTGNAIQAIRYSQARSKLYLLLQGGRTMEYNPVFRRFTDAALADYQAAGDGASGADLTGLTLDGDNFFLGDAIRDKYMRRAPIVMGKVFDYDNLWVLTAGLGPFYGSARRKQASSFWFGLDYPATAVIYPEGNNIWYGSCRSDYPASDVSTGIASQSNGALVRSKADLNGWKTYPAQLEYGFGDGCVRDVTVWRDYIWLATNKGVVRHDPRTGLFRNYNHLMGSTDVRVNALHVHENQLFVGTERGVGYLEDPDKEEIKTVGGELPIQGGVQVYELISKDKDLWAATRLGLIVFQKGAWKTLNDVSGKDVPEASLVSVPSMAYHDSSMYWVYENRVMVKPRKQAQKVLLERDHPFRLRFDGDMLYIAFTTGVTAYDTRKGLWTDFRLEDGIPGTRVLSMALSGGKLWMGTDAGIERINLRPYLP